MTPRAAVPVLLSLLLPIGLAAQTRAPDLGDGSRGTLVVVNKAAARVNLIDVASGRIAATLPTGDGPHEVALSADGRTAVVTNYGGGAGGRSLSVVDVRDQRVVRTIDLGEYTRPHGIQFLPGDTVVAVTSEAARAVVLVDVRAGAVVGAVSTEAGGSHMLAVTEDGERVFTGDMQSNTVTALDLAAGGVERAYPVPERPEAVMVSADGSAVWVGSNAEARVSRLDPESGEVRTILEDVQWPYRILLVPSRDLVVVPDLRGHAIRFSRMSTGEELPPLDMPGGPQGITVTPDERALFLSLSERDEVAVIDLETGTVIRRIATGRAPDGIQWSPVVSQSPR